MSAIFVTTLDNPFDYWTQFDDWYTFDTQKGYNTCAYVARIAVTSNEQSERDYEESLNQAIEEILRFNVLGIYKKTVQNEETDKEKSVEVDDKDEETLIEAGNAVKEEQN